MNTRLAPTILAQAFARLMLDFDTQLPLDNATRVATRAAMEAPALEAFTALWHGVEIEEEGPITHVTLDDRRHSVNGRCTCGQRCAARAIKRLVQIARDLNRPRCTACGDVLSVRDGYNEEGGFYTFGRCINDDCPQLGAYMQL